MYFTQKPALGKKIRFIFIFACLNLLTLSRGVLLQASPVHAQNLNMTAANIRQAGQAACANPPANFDPLTASTSELLYYGFPNKDPNNMSQWLDVVKHSKNRDCTFETKKHATQKSASSSPLSGVKSSATSINATASYDYSRIWSGYVVGDGTPKGFNAVWGYWHNPCLVSSKTPVASQMAMWVGLGGWKNDNSRYNGNIWQAGTEVETGGPYEAGSPSHPVYHLWYETYPAQDWRVDTSQNLSCGDLIWGDVDYNYTISLQNYAYVVDETNGHYISYSFYPASPILVPDVTWAEWIDERPSCPYTTAYHQLPDFNYMSWTGLAVHPNGSSNVFAPSQLYNSQVTMDEANYPYSNLTSPGNIGSDGKSFRDNFNNSGNGNDNSC